jgi:Fe-S cluster assembly protein SufD
MADRRLGDAAVPPGGRAAFCGAPPSGAARVTLAQGAAWEGFILIDGAAEPSELTVELTAPGAAVRLGVLFLLRGDEAARLTVTLHHAAPHTRSELIVRAIVADQAAGAFTGAVRVARGADGTDADQNARGVLLSPRARMEIRPELEIYADDVVCAHGATCGAPDPGALFYMRSRGVPEGQARALLLQGFAAQALEVIADDAARGAVRDAVAAWLSAV